MASSDFDSLNPYRALYDATPKGPGDGRPTALRVLQDNDAIGKWQGRVMLITGGTSGIGLETARVLHATGADVYFTARDAVKAKTVVEDIRKSSTGSGKLDTIPMDLDSLDSVREAARIFLTKADKLNVLINNAGKESVSASRIWSNLLLLIQVSWAPHRARQKTVSNDSSA